MLGHIWVCMILASILCAACTGRLPQLSNAVLDGAQSAVELSVSLLGSMCLWLGFLRIAEESGLSEKLARLLSPVIDRLFPEYKNERQIKRKICLNFSANLLGLGNAATPLGLAAMKAMQSRNPTDKPTDGMVLFVVMNTASLQLLPINAAALRAAAGSSEPFAILPQVWVVSLGAVVVCVVGAKILGKHRVLQGKGLRGREI